MDDFAAMIISNEYSGTFLPIFTKVVKGCPIILAWTDCDHTKVVPLVAMSGEIIFYLFLCLNLFL